jgi:dihydrofolate reductase
MREVWGQYSHMVIIGGGEVYRSALNADIVDVIHLSVIHHPTGWEHDVTFPDVSGEGWACATSQEMPAEEGAPHGWARRRLVRDPGFPSIHKADVPVKFTMNWRMK